METFSAADVAAVYSSTVRPTARKLVADSWASSLALADRYNPREVHVNRVTGGFNSAVQVAASYCLRSYAERIDADSVSIIARRRGAVLTTALEQLRDELTDPFWATFVPEPTKAYGIGYSPRPVSMSFAEPGSVTILFRADLALLVESRKLNPPGGPVPQFPGGFNPLGPVSATLSANLPAGNPAPVALPVAEAAGDPTPVATHPQFLPGAFAGSLVNTVLNPVELEVPLQVQRVLGTVEVTLKARLRWTAHKPQKSVDILLDLRQAEVTVNPGAGDARALYEELLAPLEPLLASHLAPHADIPLTPTISLIGRNTGFIGVPELPQFEVRVFPVQRGSRQALCAAFDVVPGCQGIIEDVEHFIGASDYGVIHDEYVVERVIRHKWNQGGFDRSVGVARKVSLRVKRDGRDRDEDAWVYGRLLLDSLDEVALQPHADLRGDLLLLSGQARGVADRVVLTTDGTVLTPENADLGPPEAATWAVNLAASLTLPWEPDAELRDFRQRAHTDGLRHLARPFARFPFTYLMPDVEYVRTEAVLKRMFFLGQLPGVFA
ncbi:hypothetical protein LGH70_05185 [Hymenobacter sp. BT635]|uniref:Baseplate protein J-like domain-containing protein n=1 Tax=Hymenobacter nitidus TaxID=2880929 RepID=A0ABS8A992_9BACT|nr:hypothetical protein [Hymenobacter nitidus]MCB2376963.1 hypothetical protein [Hymenobacter nitidus]